MNTCYVAILINTLTLINMYAIDVALIGNLGRFGKRNGNGLHAATFLQLLKSQAHIYFHPTDTIPTTGLPNNLLEDVTVINDTTDIPNTPIVIYTKFDQPLNLSTNAINIAYMAWESTVLTSHFVNLFNKFDAIIVPDQFLVDVFKSSGVKKPVFVMPLTLDLAPFFAAPIKQEPHKIFTFGCTAAFVERKNMLFLLTAFNKAFGNNPRVRLIIHGNQDFECNRLKLIDYVKQAQLRNVIIDKSNFDTQQLINFYQSLDCYILLSKGEGFSITPREAMSLGIPCILSNNTGHKIICSTNLVVAITSNLVEPVNTKQTGSYGYWFNSNFNQTVNALYDMYHHYEKHLHFANQRREWTRQYLPENLMPLYGTLINPQQVTLGTRNKIINGSIETASQALYKKYMLLAQSAQA